MCGCVDKVNDKLAEYNGLLETNWLSDPPRAMISIVKKSAAGTPKKPPLMEATFCPFCGEKYQKSKDDLADPARYDAEYAMKDAL